MNAYEKTEYMLFDDTIVTSDRIDEYTHGGAMFSVHDGKCSKCLEKYVMKAIKPKNNILEKL